MIKKEIKSREKMMYKKKYKGEDGRISFFSLTKTLIILTLIWGVGNAIVTFFVVIITIKTFF